MTQKYKAWISVNYSNPRDAVSQCKEACHKMKESFSELIITNGLVLVGLDFRQHWWCKTEDGDIVDPTAHQYEVFDLKISEYQEIDDDHDLRKYPQCKCMNCGEYFFYKKDSQSQNSCSDKCSDALDAYYNKR
jgi:hypothetical protein